VDFPGLTRGPYLRLRVSDTGHGMTPEILERVFDPFFTTKGTGEGSGMGLSVVHSIVKTCGGAVFAASEAGAGSSFTVFLPRLTVEVKPEKAAEEASLGSGERILLAEDEDTQRESLVRMLERLGYAVTNLADGAAALEEFRKDPQAYDLVITDQSMPKMSGSELAEAVLAERDDLPVILCTGFSDAVDGKRARAKGVREFVVKPFTLAEISKTIRRALAGTGAGKKGRGRKPEQA
jgi:two-component system cell cycle sensor histidine kinase/response regulator CckA